MTRNYLTITNRESCVSNSGISGRLGSAAPLSSARKGFHRLQNEKPLPATAHLAALRSRGRVALRPEAGVNVWRRMSLVEARFFATGRK